MDFQKYNIKGKKKKKKKNKLQELLKTTTTTTTQKIYTEFALKIGCFFFEK